MAKVEVNLKSIQDALGSLKITLSGKDGLMELAQFWRDRIVNFTRSGKDLSGRSDTFEIAKSIYPQPKLTQGTIRRREKFAATKPTHPLSSPGFSNLTQTGDLLDGLKPIVNESTQEIGVEVAGSRSDGEDNKAIAKDLAERDRRFLGLDDQGYRTLRVMAKRNILRQLQSILKNNK